MSGSSVQYGADSRESPRSSDFSDRQGRVLPGLTRATMTPDAALELSLQQLIRALSKKLFGECARIRSTMPPPSRSLVATLTAEVRSLEPR